MRVVVDPNRCVGVGLCEAHAPEFFVLNDLAVAETLVETIPAEGEGKALDAVRECPSGALRIE